MNWQSFFGLVLGAAGLCACGAEPASDDTPQRKAACDKLAQAHCGHLEGCTPFALIHVRGGMAQCLADEQEICLHRLAAPGTGLRHADITACAVAQVTMGCHEVPFRDAVDACHAVPGTVAAFATCGDDSQCETGYCMKNVTSPCGKCEARKAVGKACNEDDDCEDYKVCRAPPGATSTTKKCLDAVTVDMDCAVAECVAPYLCKAGTCMAGGGEGDKCSTTVRDCDAGTGLWCHGDTEKCVPKPVIEIGGACGYIEGVYRVCEYGADCLSLSGGKGTCKVLPEIGEGCSTSLPCRAPAYCFNGVCGLAEPAACE